MARVRAASAHADVASNSERRPFGTGRLTPQRRSIAAAIESMSGAFTVDDLVHAVRVRRSATGTATIYRAVAAMESEGWLERVGERSGSVLYLRCAADDHHHHLVCTGCGRVEAATCPLEGLVEDAVDRSGFLVTEHEITLYGLCATCRPGTGEGGVMPDTTAFPRGAGKAGA